MKRLLLVMCALLIAGCASREDQARAIDAQDHASCENLGYQKGTESYGNCRLQIMAIREQSRANAIGAFSGIMQGQRNMIMLNR